MAKRIETKISNRIIDDEDVVERPARRRVPPPRESRFSVILKGIGAYVLGIAAVWLTVPYWWPSLSNGEVGAISIVVGLICGVAAQLKRR